MKVLSTYCIDSFQCLSNEKLNEIIFDITCQMDRYETIRLRSEHLGHILMYFLKWHTCVHIATGMHLHIVFQKLKKCKLTANKKSEICQRTRT